MNKEALKTLIDTLIEHGENKDELIMWYELFDTLDQQAQEDLIKNLEEEYEKLKKL